MSDAPKLPKGLPVESFDPGDLVYTAKDMEDFRAAGERAAPARCPRPCNGRPDDWPAADCIAAGECGCGAAPPAMPQDAARAEPVWAADGWRQECDDADAVLRLIGLDPERCRTEGGWLNVPKIRTMLRDRALVYLCPAGCGCTWRDNGDGSMSLYGPSSRSCAACETMPLSKLVPVYATPPATSAEPVTVSTSDEPKSDVLSVERDANDDATSALPPGAREAMRMAADALTKIDESRIWPDSVNRNHAAIDALRPWLRDEPQRKGGECG